jgi:hypothetical protein
VGRFGGEWLIIVLTNACFNSGMEGRMAILKRCFFAHEKGNHDETWYYLARDTETGRVFIIHEWAVRANLGERPLEIAEFLAMANSTAQSNLLKLIGSLIEER